MYIVDLQAGTSIMTYDNASTAELTCEMSGYAPPNSLLKWYRGNTMLYGDEKYSVVYRDNPNSSSQIQRGSGLESSVLGVLVVSDPVEEDSGTYHCRIEGYNLEAEVQLQVKSECVTKIVYPVY